MLSSAPPDEELVALPVEGDVLLLVEGDVLLLVEGDVLLLVEGDVPLLVEGAVPLLVEGAVPLLEDAAAPEPDPAEDDDGVLLELELLPGATFTLLSIEVLLDEEDGLAALLAGGAALPDELRSSVELFDEPLDGAATVAPGTTAVPFTVSVVTAPALAEAAGTLGMQPTGLVFAASMHLGSSCTVLLYVVTFSARAAPKVASRLAARKPRGTAFIVAFLCAMAIAMGQPCGSFVAPRCSGRVWSDRRALSRDPFGPVP